MEKVKDLEAGFALQGIQVSLGSEVGGDKCSHPCHEFSVLLMPIMS